ncbi:testis-expressed protein 2 isoform X2 [Amyelois transitella]|uniref:testis-expressed protein 2 isoform X2 n=1 Tax=Amyelois transitella TaxID=680683 RepID=UPI0029902838|nr:testis-expressed protein 2 isoform X2 [Amyelois transitella]
MELSGTGKTTNTSLSFRYNANNEELEELYHVCDDDPPTPQCDPPSAQSENASPKKSDKSSSSILDKYFKSMRTEKVGEKSEDVKNSETKGTDESKTATPQKEVTASPMKEYLNRLSKRSNSEVPQEKDSNETWKIFHDFKFKIAQAVEDMKTRSVEETKEKSVPRENSTSDSEDNSAVKDVDQQSVGDTDNQVSSLGSSIQNLSEMTQPLTAKATEREASLPTDNKNSDSSDDTHKNLAHSDSADMSKDFLNDSNMLEVESGVEALEDTLDGYTNSHVESDNPNIHQHVDKNPPSLPSRDSPTNFGLPPSKSNLKTMQTPEQKTYFFNFSMYFLTFLLFVNFILFPKWNIWNGFLLGLWFFSFSSNFKQWLMDTYFSDDPKSSFFQLKRSSMTPVTYTIPSVKEHTPLKKYEGWINHYRFPDYDPYTYTITKTTSAFMKLEGCNLRLSYTTTKVPKKALWDEKIENVIFYQHRLYNLTGARVILLPKGLVRRRQWSKKYPICIILSESEKIQVLEKENGLGDKRNSEQVTDKNSKEQPHEMETAETNTSPEKKRKFIWRRREKSITHTDSETGKEGLRHRFVRKIHRDKKPDNVPTTTEPVESQTQVTQSEKPEEPFHDAEADLSTKSVTSTKEEDEELDESELSRIKECLEEAVSKKSCMVAKKEAETGPEGMAEGEWSVHVKQSRDKHSHLYLFTRTGRDKIEWFRRLSTAISEANASADISSAEEKSASEPADKDASEQVVYKVTDASSISFTKPNKSNESVLEGVPLSASPTPTPFDMDKCEKNFWPYILKIIQSKSQSPTCECRMLPAEVSWVNTVLARLMYDVMSDSVTIARLQNRIQRKLNTLKLPSFMSPLCVREVSLRGACPVLARVWPPQADARGVWIDADLRYDGGAHIALLTQINLLQLKEKNVTLEDHILGATEEYLENEVPSSSMFGESQRRRKPAVYDSDVEDSAESSSDDDCAPVQPVDSADNFALAESAPNLSEGGSSKKKFLRMVDKIATNKYFQQVTDYKYVKRAMEGLSNTDIKLQVEVQALEGRLTLNLPPPPHDRLWIGFRSNPQLVLKARPAVGARALRFAHISNWIEQKLSKEFEKILVLPNMEDIVVDVLTPTPVEYE